MTLTLSLLASAALILANGAFVAYEFALIAANRSAFEARAEQGSRVGRAAVNGFSDLSMQLAGAQVGITVASLILGYVGEPAVAILVESALGQTFSDELTHTIGFVVALSIVAFLHLLVGEMIPKNIAIAAPDTSVNWLILPYGAYLRVVRPFVRFLNWLARIGCRAVGVEPQDELVSGHDAAELSSIVSSAFEEGSIQEESVELLRGALDFAQRPVIDVASSLDDIATIRFGTTPAQAEQVVRSSGQTRVPVLAPARGENRLIGYLHAKDLLAVDAEMRFRPIPEQLHRPMVLVRAEQPLIEVLRRMRRLGRQLAVVISAEGPVGVVSVEQIIRALIASNTIEDV